MRLGLRKRDINYLSKKAKVKFYFYLKARELKLGLFYNSFSSYLEGHLSKISSAINS